MNGRARHVIQRFGSTPAQRGSNSKGTCPDVFSLSDGSFALIGTIVTPDREQASMTAHPGFQVKRRIGSAPAQRGSGGNGGTCPDVLELTDGRFAVIGSEATAEVTPSLPADAGVADYEGIVVLTREAFLDAAAQAVRDFPEEIAQRQARLAGQ